MKELTYVETKNGNDSIVGDMTHELSVNVPAWIIGHPMLSDRAVRLFAYMKGAVLDAIHMPGLKHVELAKTLNVSERTAREAIYELRDAGAIKVVPRFKGNAQIGNAYYLWPALPDREGWQAPATGGGDQLPADIDISNIKDISAQNSATPKKRTKQNYDEQFATLWKLYPRHVNKSGAYKAYCALVKRGVKHDDLLEATKAYAAQRIGQDEQFTLYPSTFYGPNDRWADYLPKPEEQEAALEGQALESAKIYDSYDRGGQWLNPSGDFCDENPAKYGYTRPTNSKGKLVSADGVPYELDGQGQRRNVGYWNKN